VTESEESSSEEEEESDDSVIDTRRRRPNAVPEVKVDRQSPVHSLIIDDSMHFTNTFLFFFAILPFLSRMTSVIIFYFGKMPFTFNFFFHLITFF
jgi:hypothetical protein